jgi:hypothetical protein
MRPRLLLAVATSLVLGLVGVAVATHVPQVDPATVPTGFLATHNHVADVPEASFRRIAGAPGGFDTHVQHVRLTAGTDTGWHTHPGPAVVSVVKVSSGTRTRAGGRPMARAQGSSMPGSVTSITRSQDRTARSST